MMGSFAFSLFMFIRLLFSFTTCFHHLPLTVAADHSSSNFKQQQPLLIQCHDDERSALLQFNQSFLIDVNASLDPSAYPKTASWKLNECCSWDGVECDGKTGHVIGLDLSSSCLYGFLNSTSTVFSLLHLQKLNLAYNNFNYSQIPSTIGRLSMLTHLDLSYSLFSGQIPSKILELSKLASLDLSHNRLKLEKPNLSSLLQNLTDLKVIHLSHVNISSAVPRILANFSSLTSLQLEDCGLHGEFPTSIFQIPNLQILNVRFNPYLTGFLPKFNKSNSLELLIVAGTSFSGELPNSIGDINSLKELDISGCNFSGSVPYTLGNLPNLLVLRVGSNPYLTGYLPEFNKTSPLEYLILSHTSFSGKLPDSIGNLNSLKGLDINGCNFSGKLPDSIGNLKSLKGLYINGCNFSGKLPDSIGNLNSLKVLYIGDCNFSGKLPDSIGNLNSLKELYIGNCKFSGLIPASLSNLTQLTRLHLSSNNFSGSVPSSLANLTQLTTLDLSSNNFNRGTLAWLGKQTKLISLQLAGTNLIGDIPPSLRNLTQLTFLSLHTNQLSGQIPSSLANLTQLTYLELDSNELQGPIPQSIFQLPSLYLFHLNHNNLNGTVEFDTFLKLESLVSLQLSYNDLSLLTKTSINATLRKFKLLGLATCNLSEFPDFLQYQDELEFLELSQNRIQGQMPKWVWNIGKETLMYMSVSYNFLTSFGHPPIVLPWTRLQILNLESNLLQGSLLIPPPSTLLYLVSNNSLTGEISPRICNLTSLQVLDLSNNNLSGILPNCLGHFSDSLVVLNLRNNSFHGTIPRTYAKGSKLRMIDSSQNRLQGSVPRSLANCKMLEILDLGNNKINDTFPSWLGTFSKLRILILRSNEFHGPIRSPGNKFEFPMLRVIDISYNNFTGKLPFEYFQNWNAMKKVNVENFTYMQTSTSFGLLYYSWDENYKYSMLMTNKGNELMYTSIPEIFTALDLSSNKFEGDIPKSIGNLKELQLLNLSDNSFTGSIPRCLGSLTKLESLDLSQNNLSGEIPQQLTRLTFLEFFNVSHNHLMGLIPQGKQFDTFQNISFEGNPGLCGNPLSKKCKNSLISPPPPPLTLEEDRDSKFPSGYDWIFILAGSVSGLVVGLVVGHSLTTRKHEWFVETFGRRPQKRQREKKRGQRNVV